MSDYIISCCSTADLTKEHFDRRNIRYACAHFSLNGMQYDDDLGESFSLADFYQAMADGADTKTSQINAAEFEEYFEAMLKEGKDIMIGFNPKFFIDALRVIDEEEVTLYMVNPKAPCFIKNSEESYIYLILPVNFTTV